MWSLQEPGSAATLRKRTPGQGPVGHLLLKGCQRECQKGCHNIHQTGCWTGCRIMLLLTIEDLALSYCLVQINLHFSHILVQCDGLKVRAQSQVEMSVWSSLFVPWVPMGPAEAPASWDAAAQHIQRGSAGFGNTAQGSRQTLLGQKQTNNGMTICTKGQHGYYN